MDKKNTGERLDTRALGPVMLEHLHRYAIVQEAVRDKIVLDVACGEGYGSKLLADVAARVTGVDADAATITDAQQKYKHTNLHFVKGNITALPFEASSFDVVICFETLEHVAEHEAVIIELKRVLKQNGVLIISTPNKEEYSEKPSFTNPFHVKELTVEGFRQLLNGHFTHCRYYLQECLLASIICSEDDASLLESFTGDFTAVTKTQSVMPVYVIAVASQQPFPLVLPSGFFRNDVLTQRYFLEERESAKTTASYKLGHALLWPAKKIFSIFQKKGGKA